MKPLTDLGHYEVLEISPDARASDVERAYQLAMATYADDSMAGYSVFESGDAATMRERIETAHRVLSDAEARAAYDEKFLVGAETSAQAPVEAPQPLAATLPETLSEIQPLEAFDEDSEDYDGARLRRARLRRGFEIEGVARVTKVNPTYLRFLEEDRFAELPPRVYVRGFLMAFATCVGLDPNAVAGSYLERFDHATKAASRRSRGA